MVVREFFIDKIVHLCTSLVNRHIIKMYIIGFRIGSRTSDFYVSDKVPRSILDYKC